MSKQHATEILKKSVSQICQNIGWHGVHASPMDILVDLTRRYIFEICKTSHQYANYCNRVEPNFVDLALVFDDFQIVDPDIREYVNNVESIPFCHKVQSFPAKNYNKFCHPKRDSRELTTRPEHIDDHLPLLHPDLEEDVLFSQHSDIGGVKKLDISGDSPSPLSSPRHGLKSADSLCKKSRFFSEDEGRLMREMTSVFMSPAGFISSSQEGISADPLLPTLDDSPPPSPEPDHTFICIPTTKTVKTKDKKEKSKSKKIKDSNKKEIKKIKKEKESPESSTSKHDKSLVLSSSKKDHGGSHKPVKLDKSIKSNDSPRKKNKNDKVKLKVQKEIRKFKDSIKVNKLKSKMKNAGGSRSPSDSKKLSSSSKKVKAAKLAKSIKQFKANHTKGAEATPQELSVPILKKEPVSETVKNNVEIKAAESDIRDEFLEDDLDFREESPERLVIDDSLETHQKREKESRQELIDECIEAVVNQGEEAVLDGNSISRNPAIKRLLPKDIYDFTDGLSECSSLSSGDIPPHSPVTSPVKKGKKEKKSGSPKKNKKDKQKKKKESKKSRSPEPAPSPKGKKSSFMLKVEDRTPSPILANDLLSSDDSSPSSSPRSNSYFDRSPPPSKSNPSFAVASGGYSSNPFAPVKPIAIQSSFPTPPLFSGKSDGSFQSSQSLAKSSSADHKENSDIIKKGALEKSKSKDHKRGYKKKGKREPVVVKEEVKEKSKSKDKPKLKPEKSIKEKKKSKPDKKEKVKDDSMKMTLKLQSGSGSTKIIVKNNPKYSTQFSSSSDSEDESVPERLPQRTPSPPPRAVKSIGPAPVVTSPVKTPTRGRGRGRKAATPVSVPPARTVITETLGTIVDESGNKIWICPACTKPDDGSPMIGCDKCDDWYHWVCVGIVVPPKEEDNWYCTRCISKQQTERILKRRKKHKKTK